MAEPRARVRAKGQVFGSSDLNELLYAFGDAAPSLPTTAAALDEILTDFIIETCHAAALSASYSRRQKIKVDDFRWVLRRSGALLGRIGEQLAREKHIREQRKIAVVDELSKDSAADLAAMAEAAAAAEEMGGEGPAAGTGAGGAGGRRGAKRGRKKRKVEDEDDGDGRASVKRRAS